MSLQNTANAVVLLEELAHIVAKSPTTYNTEAAQFLAASIRSMATAVTQDSRVDPALLGRTRIYAAQEWRSELAAVLFTKEQRGTVQ